MKPRLNDDERELWVLNDEELHNQFRSARQSMRNFIRENREEIDRYIRKEVTKDMIKVWPWGA